MDLEPNSISPEEKRPSSRDSPVGSRRALLTTLLGLPAMYACDRPSRRAGRRRFPRRRDGGGASPPPQRTPGPAPSGPGGIPSDYSSLYAQLERTLDQVDASVQRQWNGSAASVTYGAGLVPANPNIGDTMLSSQTYGLITAYLDRLKGLGVEGISIDINFPLLDPDFRGQETYGQYLDFYRRLVREVNDRSMELAIEVQPVFPRFSPLPVADYYGKLNFEQYKSRVVEQLKVVARELRPTYLTVANEPSTAATNSGFDIDDLTKNLAMIRQYVQGLRSLNLSGVKYGAGFGTWQKDVNQWTERYVRETDVDFVNIHIYPVDGDLFLKALEISDIAARNNVAVIESEAWLYKWRMGEGGGEGTATRIYSRDPYSFWEPLDKKFLEVLVKVANAKRWEFISPFWSQFFFGYMDYESARTADDRRRFSAGIRNGVQAAARGELTGTGEYYQELIRRYS